MPSPTIESPQGAEIPRPEVDQALAEAAFTRTTTEFGAILDTLPGVTRISSLLKGNSYAHTGLKRFRKRGTVETGEIEYTHDDEPALARLTRSTRTTHHSFRMPRFFKYIPLHAPPIFRTSRNTSFKLEIFTQNTLGPEVEGGEAVIIWNNGPSASLSDAMPAVNQLDNLDITSEALTAILGSNEFQRIRAARIGDFALSKTGPYTS